MTRPRLILSIVVLLCVALGALAWRWATTAAEEDAETHARMSDAEVLGRKWAERSSARLEEAPCRARGRVIGERDGVGVEGAVVVLNAGSMHHAGTDPPIVTTTGPEGTWEAVDVPPGLYSVTVTHPGHRPGVLRDVALDAGKEHDGLDLRLEAGEVMLTGRIVDASGRPISDVRVEAQVLWEVGHTAPPIYATLSDATGAYALALMPDAYQIAIIHPEHVIQSRQIVLPARGRQRDFELVPGGRVEGRVVRREDGRPVAGALVRAMDPMQVGNAKGAPQHDRAVTDEDGRFTLSGLPGGTVGVHAVSREYATLEPLTLNLAVAETVEGLELEVERAYAISGFVVVHGEETRGVRGIAVQAMDLRNLTDSMLNPPITIPSGRDGHFEIWGLAPGRYMLVAMSADWLPFTLMSFTNVEDADVTDVLLRMQKGSFVEGRIDPPDSALVFCEATIEIDEASLDFMGPMRGLFSTMRVGRSETDGRFRYGPLAAGKYVLHAVTASGRTGEVSVESDGSSPLETSVSVSEGLVVGGTVRDAAGTPIPDVLVVLHPRGSAEKTVTWLATLGIARYIDATDDEGRFRIRGVRPGAYGVVVRNDHALRLPWVEPEQPEYPRRPRVLEFREGDATLDLRVVAKETLRGRVVGPDGTPRAGAWVSAWPDVVEELTEIFDTPTPDAAYRAEDDASNAGMELFRGMFDLMARGFAESPVRTDDEGRFEVSVLSASKFAIAAETDDAEPLRGLVREISTEGDIEIRVDRPGALRIPLSGVAPESPLRTRLEGLEHHRHRHPPDIGTIELDRLLPGRYVLDLQADGGLAQIEVEVIAGETTEHPVQLHPWGRVSGRLVALGGGDPLEGIVVFAAGTKTFEAMMENAQEMLALMTGGGLSSRLTQADGRFEVGRLRPGPNALSFVHPRTFEAAGRAWVDLAPGESVDLGDVAALGRDETEEGQAGHLGLQLRVLDPGDREGLEISIAEIEQVAPSSPAAEAGLLSGDRVLRIDEVDLEQVDPALGRLLLRRTRVGQARTLRIVRDGSPRRVQLTAVAPPADDG